MSKRTNEAKRTASLPSYLDFEPATTREKALVLEVERLRERQANERNITLTLIVLALCLGIGLGYAWHYGSVKTHPAYYQAAGL